MNAAPEHISQRQLRNDSAAVLRAVENGETFIVTNNGRPVAEIRPLGEQRFSDPFEGMRVERARPGARFRDLNPPEITSDETAVEALLLLRGDR